MTSNPELFFKNNNYYARTRDMLSDGFKRHEVDKLLESQKITRIKRGLYQWNEISFISEWAAITQLAPKGIFGMFTSALQHDLTDFIPNHYDLILPKGVKNTLLSHLRVKIYHWKREFCSFGVEYLMVEGIEIPIFDAERTVCDMIRLRHRLDFAIVKEVLKTYLNRPNRNILKLSNYADTLGIRTTLNNYLDILL